MTASGGVGRGKLQTHMILKVLFCLPSKRQLGVDLKIPARLKIPETVNGYRSRPSASSSLTEPETKDVLSFQCTEFIWHI